MKLQIVENPDYILAICDEEIKESDLYLDDIHTIRKSITSVKEYWEARKDYKKIIAYLPKGNAPELNLPLLPEVVVEDNVEKLCWGLFGGSFEARGVESEEEADRVVSFGIECYKSATKVYSEDDLKNHCIDFLRYFQTTAELEFHSTGENHGLPHNEVFNKYIQSLKQPKWFVVETKYDSLMNENSWWEGNLIVKLKTTTINGKTYLVGKYEY